MKLDKKIWSYMNENDSCHVPERISVYECEGGVEKVSTLSRTAHTHIHIYTPTHGFVVCVGGEKGGVVDVVSPESG